MFAQTWIESINMIFGTATILTAMIMSFLIIVFGDTLIIMSASKNRNLLEIIIIVDFIGILALVAIEWVPRFVGGMIALVFALFGAWILTGGATR